MEGYGQFVGFCAAQGVRAEELTADSGLLFCFLRAFWFRSRGDTKLKAAAAIFAGNTIAGLRSDSRWMAYEFSYWGQE